MLEYKTLEKKTWDGDGEKDLTKEELEIIKELSFIKDGSFSISDIRGRMILLKRNIPTHCNVCNRIHDADNPFLRFSPDSFKITFDCRRSGGKTVTVWLRPEPIQENKKNFMKKFLGKR